MPDPATDTPDKETNAVVRLHKINYHANWPVTNPSLVSGTVPVVTREYPQGARVEVANNPGNLDVTQWVMLGWALTPNSTMPMDSSHFIVPDGDVNLYAVWRPRPLVKNVTKDAEERNYVPGESVRFTISFVLPPEARFVRQIRIIDSYREDMMTFNRLVSLTINGVPVSDPVISTASGTVEVLLEASQFINHAGERLELTLEFTVDPNASGKIHNEARVYVYTVFEDRPDISDGADTAIIVEEGKHSITYSSNWPGGRRGNGNVPMDYTAFTPGDYATVKGNEGALDALGYEFIGWSTDPRATVPEYPIGGQIPINDNVTLYAVWRLQVGLVKESSNETYALGEMVEYTIRFAIPGNTNRYDSVRIEDVVPAELMFNGQFQLVIGDYDATNDVMLRPGRRGNDATLSLVLTGDLLRFSDAKEIALTLRFIVMVAADGFILNTANVYYTPAGGVEPTLADASATAMTRLTMLAATPPEEQVVLMPPETPAPTLTPPNPSPQTGDFRWLLGHWMLLVSGFGLMGGALILLKRKRNK
jgi:fimbrial isopeptide formation D2 family protein